MSTGPLRPTTLEIDLDAAAANLLAVRGLVGPSRKIFAVVKADGYGYGAAEMGAVFARNGADYLAVADVTEGIRLRGRGIATPILVYPNSLPDAAAGRLPTASSRPWSISTPRGPTRRRPPARARCSSRWTSASSASACPRSRR